MNSLINYFSVVFAQHAIYKKKEMFDPNPNRNFLTNVGGVRSRAISHMQASLNEIVVWECVIV
jgi:hypothetical protein